MVVSVAENILGERLRSLREERGLRQEDVARYFGTGKSTVSQWETGKRRPDYDGLQRLAVFFGTTIAYLLGETDDPTPPSAFDREKIPITKRVPLVGRVAAGTPILAEQNIEEWVPLPQGIDADFALRVRGDSMLRSDGLGLREGQIVFCVSSARKVPEPGNMVVALVDGEATIKWLLRDSDGTWYLRASNPKYRDIPLKSEHDRIQAVVVAVLGMMPQYPGEIAAAGES